MSKDWLVLVFMIAYVVAQFAGSVCSDTTYSQTYRAFNRLIWFIAVITIVLSSLGWIILTLKY